MGLLSKHGLRIAISLVPLVVALLHAADSVHINALQRLDDVIYDARLRAFMPKTLDERIVIVDIDEKSLAEVGRWPWSRNRLAALTTELFERQQAAIVGFDVVFAEADESSGLKTLRQLAANEFKNEAGFAEKLQEVAPQLDYDHQFAQALQGKPVVMGYYFTSDRDGRTSGALPPPVLTRESLLGRPVNFTRWSGYGSNIEPLARASPVAGFFNSITDQDGVVRSIPLIAEYHGAYYESLSLAIFRLLIGLPSVHPGFPAGTGAGKNYAGLESVILRMEGKSLAIPVDERVAALVPFRGRGGPTAGSFKYIPAVDVLAGRLPAAALKDKIILVGTTAPGLLDLRVTPVDKIYPGVEAHANVISGLLDGRLFVKPDYAAGFELVLLLVTGLGLAFVLPLLSAVRAVLVSVAVVSSLVGLNFWLYLSHGLVLPLAASLILAVMAFGLNMSYGYFVESRSKRELAHLFGTYVPPELVDEMVQHPDSYSMKAASKELTVMFCDMRGFTKMSEKMEPTQLQGLLNEVFSRLTDLIRANRGTIDKYMGDCVMAFWGAPVETPHHAMLAVKTALAMANAVQQINDEHQARGLPQIGVGIGLNSGVMCVGDMGSDVRRSYTVIGDAVNLGSRLEGLSKVYGVSIVVSESTQQKAPTFAWQELDLVRVKGKEQAVGIYCPLGLADQMEFSVLDELELWERLLKAYRDQDWDRCDALLPQLRRLDAKKYLYELYSERVASMRMLPFDPTWDGATNFETK